MAGFRAARQYWPEYVTDAERDQVCRECMQLGMMKLHVSVIVGVP